MLGDDMLELKDVHFRYPGGPEVLKGVDLSVERGEIVAVIGPNGCGKTTLLMVAAGLLEPEVGEVLLNGEPLRSQLPGARRRIGLVFQDPDDQLFNPTVHDEIAFAPCQVFAPEDVEEKVLEVADTFKLRNLLDKPPYKLSMGEKRIVAMASVLVYDPELLLLDEPTANLSCTPIEEIKRILMDSKRRGKAILIASHDVEFIAETADRVYVLSGGTLRGGLATKSILSDGNLLALADMKPRSYHSGLANSTQKQSILMKDRIGS
ncbi:ABC transporter ATP-binding protein [Candidatus Bathyarchaeota archaeon]|nr:ABC transporter ATP-binding protein [Candidatus Bathyarchaeota archaeon]